MDIIQRLPFPDEVCSKIFGYACKSPHAGLCVEVLKNKLNVRRLNLPEKDEDVTRISKNIDDTSLDAIDISFYTLFKNLTLFWLQKTGVTGDIMHLGSLPNLTNIGLFNTGVTGDIMHLKSLPNLTAFGINQTDVAGDEEAFNEYREIAGLPDCYLY